MLSVYFYMESNISALYDSYIDEFNIIISLVRSNSKKGWFSTKFWKLSILAEFEIVQFFDLVQ